MRLKIFALAGFVLLLSFTVLESNAAEETDGNLAEMLDALTAPEAQNLSENTLLEIEALLKRLALDKNDPDTALRAQAYLIDVYSRLSGASRTIPNKEFYSRKADIAFGSVVKASPDYALGYGIYAVSLSLAPDFLQLHRKVQEHFENALRRIPDAPAQRTDDDWDSLAVVVHFYPLLLDDSISLGIPLEDVRKRQADLQEMATQLRGD